MAKSVSNPRFGRRTWVKLWVNEWLEGTTRFEMTDAQRAFWIDLLALGGRSRYPGIICAGKTPEGKFIGYPVNKYQSLMSSPIDIEETFALFVRAGKIHLEVTGESPIRLLKVELLNWQKFQSEYQRQKRYRDKEGLQDKLHRSDSRSYNHSDTISNATEVEVEVEVEENLKRAAAAAAAFHDQFFSLTRAEDAELQRLFPAFNLQIEYAIIAAKARADRKPIQKPVQYVIAWMQRVPISSNGKRPHVEAQVGSGPRGRISPAALKRISEREAKHNAHRK